MFSSRRSPVVDTAVPVPVNSGDAEDLARIVDLIDLAKKQGLKVILAGDQKASSTLEELSLLGVEDIVTRPLPDSALEDAIRRLRSSDVFDTDLQDDSAMIIPPAIDANAREGQILPVHGMGGGVGATTFAVNLAWELSSLDKANPPRVLLMDFDLQFGAVATYLDVERRETVFEVLSDGCTLDSDAFLQSLLTYRNKLQVFTAPRQVLPLDYIGIEEINCLLTIAKQNFDYVVIDMPKIMVQWTDVVLGAADIYFAILELDMRCAQNTQRLVEALESENLPQDKLRFTLNRAPSFLDFSGKTRVGRLAKSLGVTIGLRLPDGGSAVTQANDQGLPMALFAARNPLRKEIQKLAKSVHALNQSVRVGRK